MKNTPSFALAYLLLYASSLGGQVKGAEPLHSVSVQVQSSQPSASLNLTVVNTESQKAVPVQVRSSDTIASIQEQLVERNFFDPNLQALNLGKQQLEAGKRISEYKIGNGTQLFLNKKDPKEVIALMRRQQEEKDFEENFWEAVKKYVPKMKLDDAKGHDLVLLLGETGAGKSTMINAWLEHELGTVELDGFSKAIEVTKQKRGIAVAEIGHRTGRAQTTVPEVFTRGAGNIVYLDCPGIDDTRGRHQDIFNILMIRSVIEKAKSVKAVVCVIQFAQFVSGRSRAFLTVINQLKAMINLEPYFKNIFWVFTKFPANIKKEDLIKKLEEIKDAQIPENLLPLFARFQPTPSPKNQRAKPRTNIRNTEEILKKLNTVQASLTEQEKKSLDKWERSGKAKLYRVLEVMIKQNNIYIVNPLEHQGRKEEIEKELSTVSTTIPKKAFRIQSVGEAIKDLPGKLRRIFINQAKEIEAFKEKIRITKRKKETEARLENNVQILKNPAQRNENITRQLQEERTKLQEVKQRRDNIAREINRMDQEKDQVIPYKTLLDTSLEAFYAYDEGKKEVTYDDIPFVGHRVTKNEDVVEEVTLQEKPSGKFAATYTIQGSWRNDFMRVAAVLPIAAVGIPIWLGATLGAGTVGLAALTSMNSIMVLKIKKEKSSPLKVEIYAKKGEIQKELLLSKKQDLQNEEKNLAYIEAYIEKIEKIENTKEEQSIKEQVKTLTKELHVYTEQLKSNISLYEKNKYRFDFIYDVYPFLHEHKEDDILKRFIELYEAASGGGGKSRMQKEDEEEEQKQAE